MWTNEARDFTPWLLENADVLEETLGIEIELVGREHPVGGFSLDLLGRDLTNDCTLIVENQLAVTDHTHLGQLITYAAGTNAATVVWVAAQVREEHRQAITYLNEIAGENARFFAVEINVVRIGDSTAAPAFKLVAEPNDWHATVSASAKAVQVSGGKGLLYMDYWAKLLNELHVQMPNWSKTRKPLAQNWLNIQWPSTGCRFALSFAKNGRMRAELYIDANDGPTTTALFEHLKSQRMEIESDFGGQLEWDDLPSRRACRIYISSEGDVTNEAEHEQCVQWMISSLQRLRTAFPPSRFG